MSRTLLRLNRKETFCVYVAVSNELSSLEDSIEDESISPADVAAAKESVALCRSILSKLDELAPNSTYSF